MLQFVESELLCKGDSQFTSGSSDRGLMAIAESLGLFFLQDV